MLDKTGSCKFLDKEIVEQEDGSVRGGNVADEECPAHWLHDCCANDREMVDWQVWQQLAVSAEDREAEEHAGIDNDDASAFTSVVDPWDGVASSAAEAKDDIAEWRKRRSVDAPERST